jgi:hypothetical protein
VLASIEESSRSPTTISAVPRIGNALYLPVRLMICPEPIEVTKSPPIKGRICSPDPVGLAPLTTWRNRGR